MIRKPPHHHRQTAGFTLAELLVAATIASLAILILVGVLRKGMEISDTTQHRQRARAIIDSCFESSTYQCMNFVNIPAAHQTSIQVTIDPRSSGTNDDLHGTLTIATVSGENSSAGNTNRDKVDFKRITMTVTWTEPQGQESVVLEKTLTKLDF